MTLDGYRDAIYREVDGVALRIGALLREAKAAAPDEFNLWVERELPFGLETARRLMGISKAYESLPHTTLAGLPRPWQAMYALKSLTMHQLERGVADGEIRPDMTVEAARNYARQLRAPKNGHRHRHTRADVLAGMLMQFSPNEMSAGVRRAVEAWLARTPPS